MKVTSGDLAKDERENIRIELDNLGNSYSWIQVVPRYKIDHEGDRVLNNGEVYLKVSERTNEFIHRADRNPLPGNLREVNCSLESTAWKISIFQSSLHSNEKSLLLGNEVVYITDPETRCHLTFAIPEVEDLDEGEDDYSCNLDDQSRGNDAEHAHSFGDLVLKSEDSYFN